MSKQPGFNVEVPLAFDAAVSRVREELNYEGLGVLTEIDLRAAFKEKLATASEILESIWSRFLIDTTSRLQVARSATLS
jgi:hypothetical protein